MRASKILIGKVIGKWFIVREAGKDKNSNKLWWCRCECGTEKPVKAMYLLSGASSQCVQCGHKPKIYMEELPEVTWQKKITCAKKRGIKISLTREEAYKLFLKQNRKCALTGLDLKLPTCDADNRTKKATASLDRIDSKKSYTLDNVQWVHKDVNRMKNIFEQDYFIEVCRLVTKFNKNNMIFVDVETTGVDREKSSILSIGAVDYESGKEFYVECKKPIAFDIADEALAVNGFTREQIDQIQKSDRQGYLEFESWARQFNELILAGYHIGGFDCLFLHKAYDGTFDMKWIFGKRFVDLHSIGYYLFKESMNLDKLSAKVGLPAEAKPHNALGGAKHERDIYSCLPIV